MSARVSADTFMRTTKFDTFKSDLRLYLSCSDATECHDRIVSDVDRFLHSGERLSNQHRRVYWLCGNNDGGVDMFDSHNHGEYYVDDTLIMTVTVDVKCFLNSDDYIIDTEIEWYFNSDEL